MSGRCYCGEKFRADGYCKHRCDPALKPSVLRKQRTEAKKRAHAARVQSENVYFSPEEQSRVGKKLAEVDPLYGQAHRRASMAAAKRHLAGRRR